MSDKRPNDNTNASCGLVARVLAADVGDSMLGPNVSNDSHVTKTRRSKQVKMVALPGESNVFKDGNLERERRSSEGAIVGPLPKSILEPICDIVNEQEPLETSQDMDEDEEVVDDYNYGVGFDPRCIIGGYAVSGQIELSNGRIMEPDLRGRIKTAAKLATAMGFASKNGVFDWEAATADACNGYLVSGTKLHPLEMASQMVKCFEERPLGTPNSSEMAYLAKLVRDLEESRNLQGDFLRHLEVECSNACGQLKFENKDIQTQINALSGRMSAIEVGIKELQNSHASHVTVVNQCKNYLWTLQNASTQRGASLAEGQTGTIQRAAAPKRRIDMSAAQSATQSKRVHTVRVTSDMTTPLATPQFSAPPPAPFKPNLADIVIVLDDPSNPFSGYYLWQVNVHGETFECILNGLIYAEAMACAPPHMSSMAKALNSRFGQSDGSKWSPEFHEYKRELSRVWQQVTRHCEAAKTDIAEKWFKTGDGRDTDSGVLYESREDAMDTVAYATLKSTIQNAVDNNAGLRQLLWSSGNARGPYGWVKTDRVIRCGGEFPPSGWQGALVCGGIKGKLECAIPTSHGPYYLAPYMNLYGNAWMEVRSTITEEAAFSHRTDSGQIETLSDEGLFNEFDKAMQWDARDSANIYATVQSNMVAPENYVATQRNNATLRRGYMPAILESVSKQQSQNSNSAPTRGKGNNGRNGGQQRGNPRGDRGGRGNYRGQRGRGGTAPKPKSAYQKTQRVMAALREPVIESDKVVVANAPRENTFQFGDAMCAAQHGTGDDTAGDADVVLLGEADDTQEASGNIGGQSSQAVDGTYAGHAQASVAAHLRTSQLHAKLHKQVRGAGWKTMKQKLCKPFRLASLAPESKVKCAKLFTHYVESPQLFDDGSQILDKRLGRKPKSMSDIIRMVHNGVNMGPTCAYRDIDYTSAIRVPPPQFPIENAHPYEYFYTILLVGDSNGSSLNNMLSRDCAKNNLPLIVHSSKALFSGKRLPTVAAALSELSLASCYDALIIRCVLNACDAENFFSAGHGTEAVENYFMSGVSQCLVEIQNCEGISLQPSGRILVSLIGPTLPRHIKNGWSRELLVEIFDFFFKLECALIGLSSERFSDVTILPIMSFMRFNHKDMFCDSETDAFLQMLCRDGLHTSEVGNTVLSYLIRRELLKMWVDKCENQSNINTSINYTTVGRRAWTNCRATRSCSAHTRQHASFEPAFCEIAVIMGFLAFLALGLSISTFRFSSLLMLLISIGQLLCCVGIVEGIFSVKYNFFQGELELCTKDTWYIRLLTTIYSLHYSSISVYTLWMLARWLCAKRTFMCSTIERIWVLVIFVLFWITGVDAINEFEETMATSLNDMLAGSVIPLTILYQNARHLRWKTEEVISAIQNCGAQILCFVETHFRCATDAIRIPGYTALHSFKTGVLAGGISIYLKNALRHKILDCKNSGNIKGVTFETDSGQVMLITCYLENNSKAKKSRLIAQKNASILDEIGEFYKICGQKREKIIIVGDFNGHIGDDVLGIPGNRPDINVNGKLIRDWIVKMGPIILNKTFSYPWTFERVNCKTIIDYCFTNIDKNILWGEMDESGTKCPLVSDHNAMLLYLNRGIKHKKSIQTRSIKPRGDEWATFTDMISESNISSYNDFISIVKHAAIESTCNWSNIGSKPLHVPTSLKKIHRKILKLRRKFNKVPTAELKNAISTLKWQLNKEKRLLNRKRKDALIEKLEGDKCRELNHVYKHINKNWREQGHVAQIKDDKGNIVDTRDKMIEEMRKVWDIVIHPNPGSEVFATVNIHPNLPQVDTQCMIEPLTLPELENGIKMLKNNKSAGTTEVYHEYLKHLPLSGSCCAGGSARRRGKQLDMWYGETSKKAESTVRCPENFFWDLIGHLTSRS